MQKFSCNFNFSKAITLYEFLEEEGYFRKEHRAHLGNKHDINFVCHMPQSHVITT